MLERSIAIYEKHEGAMSPSLIVVLENMAELLDAVGREKEAINFKKRAASIRERVG